MSVSIDGKALAAKLRGELKEKVAAYKAERGDIGLAVVLIGEDPASQVYVRNKIKACEEVGIKSFSYHLPAETADTSPRRPLCSSRWGRCPREGHRP